MNRKKKVFKKRRDDTRKITITIPEELYYQVKHFAKDEIRTISQQARLFLEIGLQLVTQQPDHEHEEQEPEEKESCIGFRIERDEEYDDE